MKIDLHTHTTCSDGTYSPSELVELAKKNGVDVLAITDHDTISGLDEGRKKAEEIGIEFIRGIEFSTDYLGKEVHILGYFSSTDSKEFLNKLEELKLDRIERAKETVRKLNQVKIDISYEDILKEVTGDVVGRMHIANVLYRKGFVNDRKEAFSIYLGDRGSCYVAKKNLLPEDAVEMIKKNNGVSFIAHPKLITLGHEKVNALIDRLTYIGLDGLEVYYPNFTDSDIGYYEQIADDRKLLVCGGSDFHGGNRSESEIGSVRVPNDVYYRLKERI